MSPTASILRIGDLILYHNPIVLDKGKSGFNTFYNAKLWS